MGVFDKAKAKAQELADKAQESETIDKAKAKAQELADKAQESGAVDKASAQTEKLAAKMSSTADELAGKAQDVAADHKDQLSGAIDKAEKAANRVSGGRYQDKIAQAAGRAQGRVEGLQRRTDGHSPSGEGGGRDDAGESGEGGSQGKGA
jgi:uncharacterized protein YjbJ (UPF0337 family)